MPSYLPDDRYFSPDSLQNGLAVALYETIAGLPLICPHGHVDPRLFADPDYSFGSPAELLVIPDHYIFRMLYSQGIPLEALGVPRQDGGRTEENHRQIWQLFADNFYLFRGTPTGVWIRDELATVFGVTEKLNAANAQAIYDQIDEKLQSPEFSPRQLFERFNIEVLCTTDAASEPLKYHRTIAESGWSGRVLPTFRPDAVINLDAANWRQNIADLSQAAAVDITDYRSFVQALEQRRNYFKAMGATATDHAAQTAYTEHLNPVEAEEIFQRALQSTATVDDAIRFTGHMLIEMARMSIEDGLVMQLHVGALRDHNERLYAQFGPDKGADIPLATEFTRELLPLLNDVGNDLRLTLILFNLNEATYARELAPLAGHYPALKLGPPWWFFDSLNGMRRYFDRIVETAGLYNTAGFNDDTRAFPSIPARHDLWRRAAADWVAGLVVRRIVDEEDGAEMVQALAHGLAKEAYKL